MATGRNSHTATLLANGNVLVAGGFSDHSGTLSSAELYQPPDAALHIKNWAVSNNVNGTTVSVAFTDDDPSGSLSQYKGTFWWGDQSSSAATLFRNSSGYFVARGFHHYVETGTVQVTVSITDVGGAWVTETQSIAVG